MVKAKIVDDDEWRKVQEGVYTGFSQGGRYVKRWPDEATGLTRYTAEPREISLVDLPCLPDATFEVVKDGVVEKRAFSGAWRASEPEAGVTAADGGAPEGTGAPAANPAAERASSAAPSDAQAKAATAAGGANDARVLAGDQQGPREARQAEPQRDPARDGAPLSSEDLFKTAHALADAALRLDRAEAENQRLTKALDALGPALADLVRRVAALEAQPLPPRAALRAVAKTADGETEALGADDAVRRLAALSPEARALALTKLSLASPLRY